MARQHIKAYVLVMIAVCFHLYGCKGGYDADEVWSRLDCIDSKVFEKVDSGMGGSRFMTHLCSYYSNVTQIWWKSKTLQFLTVQNVIVMRDTNLQSYTPLYCIFFHTCNPTSSPTYSVCMGYKCDVNIMSQGLPVLRKMTKKTVIELGLMISQKLQVGELTNILKIYAVFRDYILFFI